MKSSLKRIVIRPSLKWGSSLFKRSTLRGSNSCPIRKEIQTLIESGSLNYIVGGSGYINLARAENEELFELLHQVGYFRFYTSNSGEIVGLHQIVAYLDYGWKAYRNGFRISGLEVEVHHYNGNTGDNRPENLVYLSRQDHACVSSASKTNFYGVVKSSVPTPFNRQGKQVLDHKDFLVCHIALTLKAIGRRRRKKIEVNITRLIMELPAALYRNIDKPVQYFFTHQAAEIMDKDNSGLFSYELPTYKRRLRLV
jgi:hypothetical protein